MTQPKPPKRVPKYSDEQIYDAYLATGSGVLAGLQLGLSQSYVSLRLRTYRRDVLGIAVKAPRLSLEPRTSSTTTISAGPTYSSFGSRADEPRPQSCQGCQSCQSSQSSCQCSQSSQDSRELSPELRLSQPAEASEDSRIEAKLDELIELVRTLVARPPQVVEWRPSHKRLSDGGTHVSEQRAMMTAYTGDEK